MSAVQPLQGDTGRHTKRVTGEVTGKVASLNSTASRIESRRRRGSCRGTAPVFSTAAHINFLARALSIWHMGCRCQGMNIQDVHAGASVA